MKSKLISIFVLLAVVGASFYLFQPKTAQASCDPSGNPAAIPPKITAINEPSGSYPPGDIPVKISGQGGYKCEGNPNGGLGWEDVNTTVVYTITNSAGTDMVTKSWNTPICNVPICPPRAINVDQVVDGSNWASGQYTISATATGADDLTSTKTGTFNINGPGGTITATDCTISNSSTCTSFVSWTTHSLIPGAYTAVTANNNSRVISTDTNADNFSAPINFGQTTFFLYHNGIEPPLAQVTVNASCPFGMNWNGSECSYAPAPSGTISASDCTITSGTTCNSLVTWTTQDLLAGKETEVTHNNPDHTSVSYLTSGTNVSTPVHLGETTFYLYHNGLELAKTTIVARSAVPIDGRWGWGPWGLCDENGRQSRSAVCTPPINGGADCPNPPPPPYNTTQSRICGSAECGSVHGTCNSGSPSTPVSHTSNWTWTCTSLTDGAPNASCTELKKKPTVKEL